MLKTFGQKKIPDHKKKTVVKMLAGIKPSDYGEWEDSSQGGMSS